MKWLKDLLFPKVNEPIVKQPTPEYGGVFCKSCGKFNKMELQTLFEFTRQPLMYKVTCLHCGEDVV